MHGRFFENFIKSWKITLVTYKNVYKVQAVPTREGGRAYSRTSFEKEFKVENLEPTSTDYVIITSIGEQN